MFKSYKTRRLATLALLLTLLTACGASSGSSGTLPSGTIQPDDFDIYLNGSKVIEIEDEGTFEFFKNSDHPYETRRGIKVGSSLADVAKAYANEPVFVGDFDDESNNTEDTIPDFGKYLGEHPAFMDGNISFRQITIDGKIETDIATIQKVEKNYQRHEVYISWFFIGFRDGIVSKVTSQHLKYEGGQ